MSLVPLFEVLLGFIEVGIPLGPINTVGPFKDEFTNMLPPLEGSLNLNGGVGDRLFIYNGGDSLL